MIPLFEDVNYIEKSTSKLFASLEKPEKYTFEGRTATIRR